ncbi:Protein F37C4.5-like protein [Cladobotryum mycophilum]|uniref:Protein F37C4.5-like protein n=1 Tax=Cladobotryum mycophilum TaxID=491253 RepID=A0ABR0S690_9HYPO
MDSTNKVEFNIRNLGTRSVTLFPSRAQVYREIKDVSLKTGVNEITIVGLSPTVDEGSIKVEGSGSAVITDIAIQYLPNRDIFDDFYPDSESGSGSDDEDSESDEDHDMLQGEDHDMLKDDDAAELQAARERLIELQDDLMTATEIINSSNLRMEILTLYGRSLTANTCDLIPSKLEEIKHERAKAFDEHMTGVKNRREAQAEVTKASREVARLEKLKEQAKAEAEKGNKKARAAKAKEVVRQGRLKEEYAKERRRVRKEHENFWPKNCYSVCVTLEVMSTPASSRRASISSDIDIDIAQPFPSGDDASSCDLLLSYITVSAHWSPSYDLQLSTADSTGKLCFDAQLHNYTSETWSNCKVTLSTSETAVLGLQESIPTLTPWLIKLASKGTSPNQSGILRSQEERDSMENFRMQHKTLNFQKSRPETFWASQVDAQADALADYNSGLMMLHQGNKKRRYMVKIDENQNALPQGQQPGQQATAAQQATMVNQGPTQQQQAQMLQQQQQQWQAMQSIQARQTPVHTSYQSMNVDTPNPISTHGNPLGFGETLDFQDSQVEESGLTMTYDLPGLKTLAPKTASSRQRIVRVTFSNIEFSHTVVAKYKPVSFIKAKLKNSSKLTLIKGEARLTLDGSFIGKTTLPRCSSGGSLNLNLGVDPDIKVIYHKPEVRRPAASMFSNFEKSVYVRTMTLHNTRAAAGKLIKLLVLDQVPIAEDERLGVEILSPEGLEVDGSAVASGVPGREMGEDGEWGDATAKLRKRGEVQWDVRLNAGKAVKLSLGYVVSVPTGAVVV